MVMEGKVLKDGGKSLEKSFFKIQRTAFFPVLRQDGMGHT
jgi:hypothetical protein